MKAKESSWLPWREILQEFYVPSVKDSNWRLEQVRRCWERRFQEDESERLHAVSECSGGGQALGESSGLLIHLKIKVVQEKRSKPSFAVKITLALKHPTQIMARLCSCDRRVGRWERHTGEQGGPGSRIEWEVNR